MELDISWPHICAEMGNALHFCLFIFSYDFENLNVVECQVTDRFFVFVAEPPKTPWKTVTGVFLTIKQENLYTIKCDALNDSAPFAQFKKREKHPWRRVTFR